MTLDPTQFSMMAVSDTCSVWNVLSSRRLYQATIGTKIHFCITPMVLYECMYKPRSRMTPEKGELIKRLENARADGVFPIQECDLEDLAVIARITPRGLGSGEVSCIATAYRIRSIAFMTDEKMARKFASEKLGLHVETTPKLYAYLHYGGYLSDGDHEEIIREHEIYEHRPLTVFFRKAFDEAMRCRLMQRYSTGSSEA